MWDCGDTFRTWQVGGLDALGLGGLWLACGFGPKGMMEAPMASFLLADEIVARLPHCAARAAADAPASDPSAGPPTPFPSVPSAAARAVVLALTDPCREASGVRAVTPAQSPRHAARAAARAGRGEVTVISLPRGDQEM
jgi:hypothetical protein